VRAKLGGSPAGLLPEENQAYTSELLATVWAPHTPERMMIGDTEFLVGLADLSDPANSPDENLVVFKTPAMIDRYRELARDYRGSRIVEVGVFWGGSTALLCELFSPEALVAFELVEHPRPALERFIEDHQLGDRVHVHYGVNQSDQVRLLEVVAAAMGDAALDVVLDDASHSYVHTRASFAALFPRLREGGVYVIEDWEWAHIPGDSWQQRGGYLPGEPALTNLIVEIMALQGTRPDLVRELRVRRNLAEVVRGEGKIASPMDFATLTMNRGNPFHPFL
jgi:hypothetical protein